MRWPFHMRKHSAGQPSPESLAGQYVAAPFCPTPWRVAREMLELGEVGLDDVVYDLGSGDGRIPILAAQEFGCRAVGIERDPDLFRKCTEEVHELGLSDHVRFVNQDFFQADLRPATVVTLYLLSAVNGQLQHRLASHLRAGSRVVSLDYVVPGWRPEVSIAVKSESNVDYTVHLYRRKSAGALWMKSSLNGHTAGAKNTAHRQEESASQVS
jgi:SAM-dependent methyltransferase